jgi:hypothetical protein
MFFALPLVLQSGNMGDAATAVLHSQALQRIWCLCAKMPGKCHQYGSPEQG